MGIVDVEWRVTFPKETSEKRILFLTLKFYNVDNTTEIELIDFKLNFYDPPENYRVWLKSNNNYSVRINNKSSLIKRHSQYLINLSNLINSNSISIINNKLTLEFKIEDTNQISRNYDGLFSDDLAFSFNVDENEIIIRGSYEIIYELPWKINWYTRRVIKYNNFFNQSKYLHGILIGSLIYNERIIPIRIKNKKLYLNFTLNEGARLNISNCKKQKFFIQHLKIKSLKVASILCFYLIDAIVAGIIGFFIAQFFKSFIP